jgi:hypothetical protein
MSDPAPIVVAESAPRRRWLSSEAVVGLVVPTIVAVVFLGTNAVLVSDHVQQLKQDREAVTVKLAAHEARMALIESTVALDRASSDKREALIEAELRDIGTKLSTLQSSVDQLQRRH